MSLVSRAFREFTRDVPLAMWLLVTFSVAFAIGLVVIVLALRRASDASTATGSNAVKRRKVLVCLFVSGLIAIGFPLLARASVVQTWSRIQGVLSLATGTARAAEYFTAMSALLNTFLLVPILVLLVELLACIGIGLALGDLSSMEQGRAVGEDAPQRPRCWDGGALAAVFVLFLLLSVGPVVLGGLWQTLALNHGFEAVAQSPRVTKLHVMDSMLANVQTQLDAGSRWALPGTLLAVGTSLALLLSPSRGWGQPSAGHEMRAWRKTLLFASACVLVGTGLLAWAAPLKAEADTPFPLPAAIPIVRLPKDLPPTVDFVGPDEIDSGPLVEIRRNGTTVDGLSLKYDNMVQQLRVSTAWRLRAGEPPIQVQADRLSIVMASDASMKQLAVVLIAAREAHYLHAIFVSPRMESMTRPVLGRIEHQNSTAAIVWLISPPLDPRASSPTSTMDIEDYPDYAAFVGELVKRRQRGKQVVLGVL
jgi:hypothetical protein